MRRVTKKQIVVMTVVITAVFLLPAIIWAVGTTRTSGSAGPGIDLRAYKSGGLVEIGVPIAVDNFSWTYGTSANAANVIYADTVTIADDANDTLDLYASGTLYDVFNSALTMESLKFLYLKNNSSDATLRAFGNESSDIAICAEPNDVVYVKPGGVFLWVYPGAGGLDITTNKNLFLDHDGTGTSSMAIDVIAMGND